MFFWKKYGKFIAVVAVLLGLGLMLGCTTGDDDDDGPTGPGDNDLPGPTAGEITITVQDNAGTPTYSWSGEGVAELTVVRTADSTTIIWGLVGIDGALISSPVTHGTTPSGTRNFVSGLPVEELVLSNVEYRVYVFREDGSWGTKYFTPTGEETETTVTVSGYVRDEETEEPISGATVTCDDGQTDNTGVDGRWEMTVEAGWHLFAARAPGYQYDYLAGEIPEGENAENQDFSLLQGQPTNLYGVMTGYVTGEESGEPLEGAIISNDDEEMQSFVTDEDGFYFGIFSTGEIDFTVSYSNWADYHFTKVISFASVLVENIEMPEEEGGDPMGTIQGNVTDAETGNALAGVLIAADDGNYTTTDAHGDYSAVFNAGSRTLAATFAGYVPAGTTLTVVENDTVTWSFQLEPGEAGTGTVSGMVVDSQTGEGIENALVESDDGVSAYTDADGFYTLEDVTAGMRTFTAEAEGYQSSERTENIAADETTTVNFTLTEPLLEGSYRFVLTWGTTPEDLDSHLKTPEIEGNTYHVAYYSRGEQESAPYASLDVDDTDGEGPETITIWEVFSGTYYYYIYNYEAYNIAGCGATVDIYDESGFLQRVTVPATGDGYYWNVLTLTDGTIDIIDEVVADEPGPEMMFAGPRAEKMMK